MRQFISFRQAVQMGLFLFSAIFLLHLLVIMGILLFDYVPIDFLWGGRIKTKEQLLIFEIISLLITIVCIFLILIKSGRVNIPRLAGLANRSMWVLFILFLFNTLGNVLAKTTFEQFFAIVTALLSFLLLRIALEKL